MLEIRAAYVLSFAFSAVVSFYGAYRTTEIVDRNVYRGLLAVFVLSGTWSLATAVGLATDWRQFDLAL